MASSDLRPLIELAETSNDNELRQSLYEAVDVAKYDKSRSIKQIAFTGNKGILTVALQCDCSDFIFVEFQKLYKVFQSDVSCPHFAARPRSIVLQCTHQMVKLIHLPLLLMMI